VGRSLLGSGYVLLGVRKCHLSLLVAGRQGWVEHVVQACAGSRPDQERYHRSNQQAQPSTAVGRSCRCCRCSDFGRAACG